MIYLIYNNENVYVWNSDDWKKLRQEHRIVGNLFGCLPRAPFQNSFSGLPSVLLDEEVTLLVEKGVGKLVKYKSLIPSADIEERCDSYKKRAIEDQVGFIIEEKKRSITSMIDRIVEGKRKKLALKKANVGEENTSKNEADLEKENILRAELERVEQTPLTHNLVHVFTEEPWLKEDNFEDMLDWKFPNTELEKLRYQVFKDLWEKGYYVTCGQKFGGDYLVYPGDPALYHAHYIILCRHSDESIPWLEIATNCRVGTSARKTFVLATLIEKELSYTSVQFESLLRCPT